MAAPFSNESRRGFRFFSVFLLFYNVAVILWGSYVRATGSGAGCGSHWPLCNVEMIPRPERIQTLIEFTHRASSGLCLVFALALAFWAWKLYPPGHLVRKASAWVLGLTVGEALLGASLVLFALVEKDQSISRAVSISLHLINTLFLLSSLVLTARWAWRDQASGFRLESISRGAWIALGATLLLGVTGALTALGDTLFHSTSLAQGFTQDFSSHSHFLVRLRVLHPALACLTGAYLLLFAEKTTSRGTSIRLWARLLQCAVMIQLLVGGLTLLMLAPIPLQMIHLMTADLTWIALVSLSSTVSGF